MITATKAQQHPTVLLQIPKKARQTTDPRILNSLKLQNPNLPKHPIQKPRRANQVLRESRS